MKNIKQLAAITLFGALTCLGLDAQTIDLKATIPFNFSVGKASMPAGEYRVLTHGTVVTVQRMDGDEPTRAVAFTVEVDRTDRSGSARLQFHRYGVQYSLTAIWDPSSGGAEVLPTGHEREMAKRFGAPVEATVVASKN